MSLVPGARFGPYEVISLLGAGGMGEVYRAYDATLNRHIALKVLFDRPEGGPDAQAGSAPSRFGPAHDVSRLTREARALASLNHRNIAIVHGLEEHDGVHALVLELIEGPTLADRIAQDPIPPGEVVSIARQIAAALAAAHERGIIHRDLKPANIKLQADGTVKVLDFGLAKLQALPESETVAADIDATRAGIIMGSPLYMSPEQSRGEPLDARTDLFALGAVLYEMATGRRAFPAAFDRTPPPMQDLPSGLRPIISKLFQSKRELRHQTAAAVIADLERLERAGAARSLRRVLLAGAALLVLLLGGTAWFLWRVPAGPVTLASEYTQITNLTESAVAPSLSPDGRMVTFKVGEDFFLGSGQIYVKLLPGGESVRLTNGDATKYAPVFTPDGSRIAYTQLAATSQGISWDTWMVPVLGGEPARFLPNASGLTWIADRQILFAEIKRGLHMGIVTATDARSDARELYFPTHHLGMAHFAYASADGRWVLVVEMDQTHAFGRPCRLVPFDGSSPGREVGPKGTCTSAAWSPDGRWMYFSAIVGGSSHVWQQRFPNGSPEQVTVGPTEEDGVAIAPDGRSLVTSLGMRRSSIWIRDAAGERPIVAEGYARRPRLSSSGTRVFFLLQPNAGSETADLRVLDLGAGRTDTLISSVSVADYDISPDETEVAFTTTEPSGASQIWIASLDRRTPPRLIARGGDQVSFGANGDLFFRSLEPPANALIRMKTDGSARERIATPPVHEKGAVSPDGRWVVVLSPGNDQQGDVLTLAVPVDGGPAKTICVPYCSVGWSADGRFFHIGVDLDFATGSPRGTLVIPLTAGDPIPDLPAPGVHALFRYADFADRPGVRLIDRGGVRLGPEPDVYVFTKQDFNRNLYRIPLH